MELNLGTAPMSDDALLRAFEACQLDPAKFHHADHIRLAWVCIRRYGPTDAETKLLAGIQKFAQQAGVPLKFLHTTTVAWARLVAAATRNSNLNDSFHEWIAAHPELLDRDLLRRYYSPGRLESPQARHGWLDPDLKPLD
jgi:hypothetical protein